MTKGYHEEEILGKAYDSRLLKRLLTYLRPYWNQVLIGVFILLLTTLLELAGPYLVKIAIDRFIMLKISKGLLSIIIIYLGLIIFKFIFRSLQAYLMQWISQHVIFDIRMQIFRHIQKLSLSFFDKNPIGRLVTRITTDVETLNDWFSVGVVSVFGDVFLLGGIIIVMLNLHWKLALLTFSVIPFLFIITVYFRKKIRTAYRDVRIRIARINSFLQENIAGMIVVQIFNREKKNFKKFDELNKVHLEAQVRSIFYYAIFLPSIDIIEAVALALIIWYCGSFGIAIFGTLVAFIQYSKRFFKPISDLTDKYNILQSAMASSERIFILLDEQPDIKNPQNPIETDNFKGNIEFKNVWFSYKDKKDKTPDYVLRDISFKVNPGEKVAIVGATGSGKTTIISLLCRFYDVPKGEILVDNINIKNKLLHSHRDHIGLVLQDVFLFAGTIEKNIRLGNEKITFDQVTNAARDVNAKHFIEKLPDKYNESLKERGGSLSTGQKQLLAFARALAFDPDILILDEATSNVDTESETLIQQALLRLMKDRTSIVIAHRLSTIQSCDRIIVMHKGKIREEGNHQELLKHKGIYYKLYKLQFMERKIQTAN